MNMMVGKGVHYCLCSPFARLESEIALDGLFQRFPDLARDIALIEPDLEDWGGCLVFFCD
jgi:cytochrome P450